LKQANELLENKVKERTAELELVIQELQSFSYTVSHDLLAPLRHINSFSSILIEYLGSRIWPNEHDYLERMRTASNRMGELIDHLLKRTRVSRAEIINEEVDLDPNWHLTLHINNGGIFRYSNPVLKRLNSQRPVRRKKSGEF
jgi:light-regulated signal transduction histidine kinase (bacteriophytochrome)